MKRYFPVFDQLRKEFLAGEMIWTFADYNVLERTYHNMTIYQLISHLSFTVEKITNSSNRELKLCLSPAPSTNHLAHL